MPWCTFFADLDGDGKAEVINAQSNGQLVAFPNIDALSFTYGRRRWWESAGRTRRSSTFA